MTLDRWSHWWPQDVLARAAVIAFLMVAVMAVATAVLGMDATTPPGMDLTIDPAGVSIPF
jgi:hypothetical protein